MHLMLSWWDRNNFYNNYSIIKYEIYIIRSDFGESVSYGSRFWSRFLEHNNCTGPRRGNR